MPRWTSPLVPWRYFHVSEALAAVGAEGTVYTVGGSPSDQANHEIRATMKAGLNAAGVASSGGWLIFPLEVGKIVPQTTTAFVLTCQVVIVTHPSVGSTMIVAAGGITPRLSDFSTGNDWLVSGFNWQPAGATAPRTYQFGRFGGASTNVAGTATGTPARGGMVVRNHAAGLARADSDFLSAAGALCPSAAVAYNIGGTFSGSGQLYAVLSFMSFGGAIPTDDTIGVQFRVRGHAAAEAS
jgi:hypothetical protein